MAIYANNKFNITETFMAKNIRLGNGALSKDTELLTPTGWVNITEVTKETLIAQYSIDGYISFAQPFYIRIEKPEKAVHIYNKEGHYDQLVGIDHAIPYVCMYSNNLKITPANRVTCNWKRKHIHTGALLGGSITALTPLDRLRIAFQADGSINKQFIMADYIQFRFVKERKIQHLHALLKAANIDYKTYLSKRGITQFNFSAPRGFYEKDFNWVDLTDVSQSWCQEFIEEVSQWDSYVQNSKHFNCQYGNNRKPAIDQVQAVATLAGYKTCIRIIIHNNGNWQTSYKLNIFGGSKSTIGDALITQIINYNDLMYCVRINTNMLLIRRKDAVSITGCGNYDARLSHDQVINANCGHLV